MVSITGKPNLHPVTVKSPDETYDLRWLNDHALVFDRVADVFRSQLSIASTDLSALLVEHALAVGSPFSTRHGAIQIWLINAKPGEAGRITFRLGK